ncbi:MAG: NrfD/PsrC family molybdoenzyme membrane anchor subunit [Planctomycetaceae bacterium]
MPSSCNTLSVLVDLGRPDRFWHLMPVIGRVNWPVSMLTWDVIVLNGYLVINLHIVGYLLYMRYLCQESPTQSGMSRLCSFLIIWAISIHTVTAFLYCGLGGRPFWNTHHGLMISGLCVRQRPCLYLSCHANSPHHDRICAPPKPARTLIQISLRRHDDQLRCSPVSCLRCFTREGAHGESAKYLFFGSHGTMDSCAVDLDGHRP